MLNFLWSRTFFGAHQIGLALVVVLLVLGAIIAFITTALQRDRVAAWLFVPSAAWVAFASALNTAILALNRGAAAPAIVALGMCPDRVDHSW